MYRDSNFFPGKKINFFRTFASQELRSHIPISMSEVNNDQQLVQGEDSNPGYIETHDTYLLSQDEFYEWLQAQLVEVPDDNEYDPCLPSVPVTPQQDVLSVESDVVTKPELQEGDPDVDFNTNRKRVKKLI